MRRLLICAILALTFAGVSTAQSASEEGEAGLGFRMLYESGTPYGAFLEGANRRREMWLRNDEKRTDVDSLARALDATGRNWHLLAIAVAGCSDSANTIPYLADLVAAAETVDMRIVHPADAGSLMTQYLTPDGRTATPTIVLLDETHRQQGAWVERPAALQQLYLATRNSPDAEGFLERKFEWYDIDAGAQTVGEIAALILAAAELEQP